MKILMTGASGFIGKALCSALDKRNIFHVDVVRKKSINKYKETKQHLFVVDKIDSHTCWKGAFTHVEVIIHCAARAHIMDDRFSNPLAKYRSVNVKGTLNLAQQAGEAGVKRFIFISSIKVNGEITTGNELLSENSATLPNDPYAVSKLEAETGLMDISKKWGLEVVIVRPPLVYGDNVKANFLHLLKLADSALPLPFGAVHNCRSLIYLDNLVDFIIQCIDHPAAANQVFLISDGEDVSLSGLISMMRPALGRPERLLSVPSFLFRTAAYLTGKGAIFDRLIGDLQVDSSKARTLLHWSPPYTLKQGVYKTIASYLEGKNSSARNKNASFN